MSEPRRDAESEKAAFDAGIDPPIEELTMAAEIQGLGERIRQLEEQLLRERAEAENSRKRSHREYEQARKFGAERLAADLCPVIDNLERGMAAAEQSTIERLREGVEMTFKQLMKVAEAHGVSQVDPLHQPFDAEQHQALSMQADTAHPDGTVVTVIEKGYRLHDRLLRPALVVVAKS